MAGRLFAAWLGWCAWVGLASWSGRAPSAGDGASPAPQDPIKFSHAQHVAETWFLPGTDEVWRDCRGCHQFSDKNEVSAPQQVCGECHVNGTLTPAFLAGWQQDLRGYRGRTRDAFRHHTHTMLECRECHLRPDVIRLKDFDIFTGPGQCVRCHAPGAAAAPGKDGQAYGLFRTWRLFKGATDEAVAKDLGIPFFPPVTAERSEQLAKDLHTKFAGPTGGLNTTPLNVGGTFDHYDHGEIACVDCHANIPAASATGVGTGQIPEKGCTTCHHSDANKKPLARAPQKAATERPLNSLGAFEHRDHFAFLGGAQQKQGVATPAAYEQLRKDERGGCAVCHVQDKKGIGQPLPDFPFDAANSKNRYLDCVGCHDVPGWRTGEAKNKLVLHDSTDGVSDGKTSGWNGCANCHVFGGTNFKTQRPEVAVERFTARTFEFSTNTHPYISTKPGTAGGISACKECHRAAVPELPSRLERRPFRHATHVPADWEAKDCTSCHPLASTAMDSAALSQDFRTYSLTGCVTCHVGAGVREIAVDTPAAVPPPPQPRQVVAFPHGPHVAKGKKCNECHELAADGVDALTKLQAKDCSQCHDHKLETEGPKTEVVFGDEVGSCVKCHHGDKPTEATALRLPSRRGSPAAATDPLYNAPQTSFAGFLDTQYHPLDVACTECHKAALSPDKEIADKGWFGYQVPRADHLSATFAKRVHEGQALKSPQACLQCHWVPRSGLQSNVNGGTPEEQTLRKNPMSPATRKKFGNDRKGYPGTQSNG